MRSVTMTEEEYLEHREESNGVCLGCGDITYGGIEPDARQYECETCGERLVFGIEEALTMDAILIEEED